MLSVFEDELSARLNSFTDKKRDPFLCNFVSFELTDKQGQVIYKELVHSTDQWKKYNSLDEQRIKDIEKFHKPSDEAKCEWRKASRLIA